MTKAYAKGERLTLGNLGRIIIDRSFSDAIRVKGSSEKMLALLDKMLDLHPKGIHLVRDKSGFLLYDGRATSSEVPLTRRGQKPIVFEVDLKLSSRSRSVLHKNDRYS